MIFITHSTIEQTTKKVILFSVDAKIAIFIRNHKL